MLGMIEPLKIFSFNHPNNNAPVPVKTNVNVWYHKPTSRPAKTYNTLCISPNKTACKIIPCTVPNLLQNLLHKNPLYKISSATPFATKFSMKAGKIAVKPIPAKTFADTAELLSMYSNVLGSTSCVKSKL